jgi:predicted DNA-binding transcriptional regulator
MNIIKKGACPFTQVPNELINDHTLHPLARFLYVYMVSKPDNWEFRNSELAAAMDMSEETLCKYMKMLVATGWIDRVQLIRNGKFGYFQYTLYYSKDQSREIPADEPIRAPESKSPPKAQGLVDRGVDKLIGEYKKGNETIYKNLEDKPEEKQVRQVANEFCINYFVTNKNSALASRVSRYLLGAGNEMDELATLNAFASWLMKAAPKKKEKVSMPPEAVRYVFGGK